MLVEKTLHEALIDYTKGKKVLIIQKYPDNSMDICELSVFLEAEGNKYLVDVAAVPNQEFEQAFNDMVHHGQLQTPEPELDPNTKAPESLNVVEKNAPNFSGAGTEGSDPEAVKENKFEIVKRLTLEGKSSKEIMAITGFSNTLVYQYQYKVRRELQEEDEPIKDFPPGHNADRHLCRTCMYRGKSHNSNGVGCEYALYNNHTRGCDVEDCNVYKKGEPGKAIKPLTL